MKAATPVVTYKAARLPDMERGIKLYNNGYYRCEKNPEVDSRARRTFETGLGLTRDKLREQVEFIGDDYGGVAGRPAALALAPDIAEDIFQNRAEYEQTALTAPNILDQIPSRGTIEILYRPFQKPLVDKHNRKSSNWLVWGAKFWHHLNRDAFPIDDSRVDHFFMLHDGASVGKYMKLLERFREFVLAHREWLPTMRQIDAGADEIPCAENKLWDKGFYGLGE